MNTYERLETPPVKSHIRHHVMKADSKIDSKTSEKVLSLAVPGGQKRALNALRWTQKNPSGQAAPTIHIGTKTVKHYRTRSHWHQV